MDRLWILLTQVASCCSEYPYTDIVLADLFVCYRSDSRREPFSRANESSIIPKMITSVEEIDTQICQRAQWTNPGHIYLFVTKSKPSLQSILLEGHLTTLEILQGCLHRQECSSMTCSAINWWSSMSTADTSSTQAHRVTRNSHSSHRRSERRDIFFRGNIVKSNYTWLEGRQRKGEDSEFSDLQLDMSDTCTDGATRLFCDRTSCCLTERSRFKRTDLTCRRNRVDVMKYT